MLRFLGLFFLAVEALSAANLGCMHEFSPTPEACEKFGFQVFHSDDDRRKSSFEQKQSLVRLDLAVFAAASRRTHFTTSVGFQTSNDWMTRWSKQET